MRLTSGISFASLLAFGLAQAATAGVILSEDFNAGDGGFTVYTQLTAGPWLYDSGSGSWATDGQDACGPNPKISTLTSPSFNVAASGSVTLSFDHRYSFEPDVTRWDGGQVRISVNGGAFAAVPDANFSANGYDGIITGSGALNGQEAFNGNSPGYATPTYITSEATWALSARAIPCKSSFLRDGMTAHGV